MNDVQLQLMTEAARQRVHDHTWAEHPDNYDEWANKLQDHLLTYSKDVEKECKSGNDALAKDILHDESRKLLSLIMGFMEFNYKSRQGTTPVLLAQRNEESGLVRDPTVIGQRPNDGLSLLGGRPDDDDEDEDA